jgi:hypothetical protein
MHPDWLRRRVTVAEAETAHLVTHERLGPEPVPFGFLNDEWRALLDAMRPGDELWEFASDDASWRDLAGRAGVCLVRDGVVVASVVTRVS